MQKVAGKNKNHKVVVYTLSTCGWCKKMKALLRSLDIEYEFVDIDQLDGEEREKVREELKKYNPRASCPTVVVDDGKEVILGFDEQKVRRCLTDD